MRVADDDLETAGLLFEQLVAETCRLISLPVHREKSFRDCATIAQVLVWQRYGCTRDLIVRECELRLQSLEQAANAALEKRNG